MTPDQTRRVLFIEVALLSICGWCIRVGDIRAWSRWFPGDIGPWIFGDVERVGLPWRGQLDDPAALPRLYVWYQQYVAGWRWADAVDVELGGAVAQVVFVGAVLAAMLLASRTSITARSVRLVAVFIASLILMVVGSIASYTASDGPASVGFPWEFGAVAGLNAGVTAVAWQYLVGDVVLMGGFALWCNRFLERREALEDIALFFLVLGVTQQLGAYAALTAVVVARALATGSGHRWWGAAAGAFGVLIVLTFRWLLPAAGAVCPSPWFSPPVREWPYTNPSLHGADLWSVFPPCWFVHWRGETLWCILLGVLAVVSSRQAGTLVRRLAKPF